MDKYIRKLNFDFLTNQRVIQLIASIESIGSSTRIEGSTMTDEEVQLTDRDKQLKLGN